ncbi:hypothetical protein GQ568_03230, partial [Patescibacteria group bacterium]|nr:hypothetical protein [Patescibacteria group bacterium]
DELVKCIVKEINGDKSLFRKFSTKLVGVHHGGEDLLLSLNANDRFKGISVKISKFQKNWQEEHPNWTYSSTNWENVQGLGEAFSRYLKENRNEK